MHDCLRGGWHNFNAPTQPKSTRSSFHFIVHYSLLRTLPTHGTKQLLLDSLWLCLGSLLGSSKAAREAPFGWGMGAKGMRALVQDAFERRQVISFFADEITMVGQGTQYQTLRSTSCRPYAGTLAT